jgi:tRNA G18 (ribose-2'-O)-methylase SpoU
LELANRATIAIEDPADPRISAFTAIRERDLTRGQGQFIAEGTVVLSMLAQAHQKTTGIRAEALLILENRLAGVEHIMSRFPIDVPVYSASREVMNAIAGFDIHRGVLALGRRQEVSDRTAFLAGLPENALVAVACGISNHDNIGAIFRNAAAFGADAILLDEKCCDPLYRKALRVSTGSVLAVPYSRSGEDKALIAELVEAGFRVIGLSPQGLDDIRSVQPSSRMALLTGTEGQGLDKNILSSIQSVRIPQAPHIDSLNAGTATGIALYSLSSLMGRI